MRVALHRESGLGWRLMRQQTAEIIAELDRDASNALMKRQDAIEELESRLGAAREVIDVLTSVASPQVTDGHTMDAGVLMLSTYGIHWLGERSGRLDVGWDIISRCDVVAISLSMIRKSKRAFYLEMNSPDYDLKFHLSDESQAARIRASVARAQPLL
jgi:hypothetical protein